MKRCETEYATRAGDRVLTLVSKAMSGVIRKFCALIVAFATAATPAFAQPNSFPMTSQATAEAEATINFPLAAPDAAAAEFAFEERANAIIRANACGRDLEYATFRSEMKDGNNYEHQGEGLLGLVIAKIAWLIRHETDQRPCEGKFEINLPGNAGSTAEAEANELERLTTEFVEFWSGSGRPTACATSQVSAGRSLVDPAVVSLKVRFRVDHACLRRQINESILAMRKDSRMGTTSPVPVPCIWGTSEGEFDATVKELVRVMYMAGAVGRTPSTKILDAATMTHMYENLLSARGEPGDDMFSLISDCADTANESLGSPEETADREYFGNEVLDALGDAGEWLGNFFVKIAVPVLFVVSGAGVLAAPFGLVTIVSVGLDPQVAITTPPFDLRIPETENHRLMIESSRYLTNAAIIEDLKRINHDNLDEFVDQQREVREWLLKRLQRIARSDFDEYNSRSYTRYSLRAILNLYDFAEDKSVRDAARIVLDLSSAKFAAGSNRGRRVAPFRRRSENDGTRRETADLYNLVSGADYEVVRAFSLAGQTQLGERERDPPAGANRRIGYVLWLAATGSMVQNSVSTYRLPRPLLEVAVERKLPFRQMVRHAGLEAYYSSPAFTMTVGGVQTGSAVGSTIFNVNPFGADHGVAMPTTLMPTIAGTKMEHLFSFRGIGVGEDRSENLCGWKGFICGLNPPAWMNSAASAGTSIWKELGCTTSAERQADGPLRYFLNSGSCRHLKSGPHFYLAALIWPCNGDFCPNGARYGFMEAVETPYASTYSNEFEFDRFKTERAAAMAAVRPDRNGTATYQSAAGDTIKFQISKDRPIILSVNDVGLPAFGLPAPAIDSYYLTRGGVINSFDGKATIRSPWGSTQINIDFTDWRNPKISDTPIPAGATTEIYTIGNADREGVLEFHKHLDADNPALTNTEGMAGPVRLGKDWDGYKTVIAAVGSPVIYAMEPDGDLYWYRHEGFRDGTDRWKGPLKIGSGWTMFDKIIAGENGVIYGRLPDGTLQWRRHLDPEAGSASWAEPRTVGNGWNVYVDIFAGSGGVLYGVRPNGDLMWHRHAGHLDGTYSWFEPSRRVGTGWQNIKAILSPGRGVIYAIKANGDLVWYRHLDHETGEDRSAESVTIATGWHNFKQVFALSP